MAPRTTKRRPPTRSKSWIPVALIVAILGGGYVVADIYDVAPGPLTLSEPWPDPEPFPAADLPSASPQVVLAPDPDAPVPGDDEVTEFVSEFADDPHVGPDPGILISDAETGRTIAELNAETPKVPASTTKLLTAIAALDAAGATYRFATSVVEGTDSDPEGITLVGSGDLTLDPGAGKPDQAIGRGGIATLAAQVADALAEQGRTKVTDIAVSEDLWEGPRMAPRWDEQELNEGWTIRMTPLALNLAKIDGQLARSSEPARDVAEALTDGLAEHGIEVTGEIRFAPTPESAPTLGTVESAPLAELAEYMLVYSDNVLAESLGRLVAVESGYPASFEGAGEAIAARLADLDVATEGLKLADASGLSSVNKISPRTLVDAMNVITADHPDLLATVRGLPIAGLEGTLRNRMNDTAAAGVVTAKTGSLRTTATIAGQVHTADGRLLHVAVMTHDWDGSLDQARMGIDRLLVALAGCGCSP